MTQTPPKPGTIGWTDLTVEDAASVRDFYEAVAGWSSTPHPMEGYDDYVMKAPSGDVVAGVCHARGPNTGVPAQWLVYITVLDVRAACAQVLAHGGEVLRDPPDEGAGMAVIRDPAGAVCALYQA